MAADKTGVDACTDTLVASTARKINMTGPGGKLELVHQSAVTNPVYYRFAAAEADLTAAVAAADQCRILLAGERLQMGVPRGPTGVWLSLISAGAAVVSLEMLP